MHLSDYLTYDSELGRLLWRVRMSPRAAVGDEAGNINSNGYRRVRVHGVEYPAHRVCWLLHYGQWPRESIDHINGDRSDNRIVNLRECTQAENLQNKGMDRRNSTGHTGVYWDSRRRKYYAQITVDGRTRSLGRHASAELAAEAYARAKARLHTFHPQVVCR